MSWRGDIEEQAHDWTYGDCRPGDWLGGLRRARARGPQCQPRAASRRYGARASAACCAAAAGANAATARKPQRRAADDKRPRQRRRKQRRHRRSAPRLLRRRQRQRRSRRASKRRSPRRKSPCRRRRLQPARAQSHDDDIVVRARWKHKCRRPLAIRARTKSAAPTCAPGISASCKCKARSIAIR